MSSLSVKEMLATLENLPKRDVKLNDNQRKVVSHGKGPLWIIAGPGSGKTEVLVLRCLRLLLVDKIDPRSIMITTFTEKAGRSLQDRLILYKDHIAKRYSFVKDGDLTQLRVGTLHSLCNDILMEYRFPGYRNFTPMDDIEQLLFIYFNSPIANTTKNLTPEQHKLCKYFHCMFDWKGKRALSAGYMPNRWSRARVIQSLFNRIVEYQLTIDLMKKKGDVFKTLAEEFEMNEECLRKSYRVDFSHMQSKFLEFLSKPIGNAFINGDSKPNNPGLKHVLVDDYQDTNPIQAEIYFSLARRTPHNLVVVGDDDQALYRFRGGTVESMIQFDQMCKKNFGVSAIRIPLVENHRSHPDIVNWCRDYITSFKTMKHPGARVANKEDLIPKSSISGDWPAVKLMVADNPRTLSDMFAKTIEDFKAHDIIQDYSDCVLLIHSTRETKKWTSYYAEALRKHGIPIYNPRARNFLREEEIQLALGALVTILDKNRNYLMVPNWIQNICRSWRDFYTAQVEIYTNLGEYVKKATSVIESTKKGEYLKSNLQEIFYHILNQEPFAGWCEDFERSVRLGYLTSIIDAYSTTPIPGHPGINRGTLRMSKQTKGEISLMWRSQFYNALVTLMIDQGLNDPENEDQIYPKKKVPFMTVHQAKGLEFPVVFVGSIDESAEPGPEHIIEEELNHFRKSPMKKYSKEQQAKEDMIRFYYVAYSRARYALLPMLKANAITPGEEAGEQIGLGGRTLAWLRTKISILEI
jgi:DNA helicase-2/ATP-dependent DNA helicase PcrA